jgi:hypothetical protein
VVNLFLSEKGREREGAIKKLECLGGGVKNDGLEKDPSDCERISRGTHF